MQIRAEIIALFIAKLLSFAFFLPPCHMMAAFINPKPIDFLENEF